MEINPLSHYSTLGWLQGILCAAITVYMNGLNTKIEIALWNFREKQFGHDDWSFGEWSWLLQGPREGVVQGIDEKKL